jgi:hypothetical protein
MQAQETLLGCLQCLKEIDREGVDIQTQGGFLECFEIKIGQHFFFFFDENLQKSKAKTCWKSLQNTRKLANFC